MNEAKCDLSSSLKMLQDACLTKQLMRYAPEYPLLTNFVFNSINKYVQVEECETFMTFVGRQ